MSRRVIFTIVSCNYIGFAATLMQSVRQHHPEADRFIILSDAMREFPDIDLAATLICCDDVNIAHIGNMKLWYTVIEFNTAVKPFAFTHFLENEGYDEALYIDPDIYLFRPLTEVTDALREHDCVLTPHMMVPLQDGKEPSDLTIMKSGVYNLGFLALKNTADARGLARWWSDRCYANCRVDIPGNMFTDQRWMDLAPVFVENPKILRHPGYNIAYWNLAHRTVTQNEDGTWLVNGLPLAFFHFSGIKPDDFNQFSKHQNRFTIENLGPTRDLCTQYRHNVLGNHWKKYSKTPYAFGTFPDGRPIDDAMRHWIARAVDDGRMDRFEDIVIPSDFFDEVDEVALEKGARLTRFMYQFWLDRTDLAAAFDIFHPDGLNGYFEWLTNGEAAKQGVDARHILAAQALRGGSGSSRKAAPQRRTPPWPMVSSDCWHGPSRDIATWLRHDVMAEYRGERRPVPRPIALLWERRLDLQQHFPCTDLQGLSSFLSWVLANGFREKALLADMLPDSFAERMSAVSSISAHYGDVPIVEGMILTRGVDAGRGSLPFWHRFPVEREGRLAHGLWYAFCAGKALGLPAAYTRTVRDWFMQRTDVACDGYRLTRGAMTLWELRADLQATFSLADNRSVWLYLRWLAFNGLTELDIDIEDFDPKLKDFLLSRSPRGLVVNQLTEMVYDSAADLQAAFTLATSEGRYGLRDWAEQYLAQAVESTAAGRMLARVAKASEPRPETRVLRPRLVLTGQWSAPSGRGEDVRGSAEALLAVGDSDFVIVDTTKSQVLDAHGAPLEGPVRVEAGINIVHMNADTSVQDWMLLHTLHVSAQQNIGFWAWELERLPSYWLHAYGFYDIIWSATRFADDAFRVEGLRPVHLVPMVVRAPEASNYLPRADLGLKDDETVFVFVFDFRSFASRKNPEAVVKAFMQAFPEGTEKARLVIKTQGAQAMPDAWARLRALASDPRIELRDATLERIELLSLIKRADAFVSLHRSEGFGRGPSEAMMLSVPAIVTDYSGTADFADAGSALPVRYTLVPVAPDEYPGVENQRWADADVDHAAERMAWVHREPENARAVGQAGQQRLLQMYSTEVVGRAMQEALNLGRPPAAAGEPQTV